MKVCGSGVWGEISRLLRHVGQGGVARVRESAFLRLGRGLPASRRARPCGCFGITATAVTRATRRFGLLSCSCAGRIY
eukprot:6174628-Pleurochrysis_carterae.AAC.1